MTRVDGSGSHCPDLLLAASGGRRYNPAQCRSVAQPGRAPRSGRGGRRFKSYHSDQPSRFESRPADPSTIPTELRGVLASARAHAIRVAAWRVADCCAEVAVKLDTCRASEVVRLRQDLRRPDRRVDGVGDAPTMRISPCYAFSVTASSPGRACAGMVEIPAIKRRSHTFRPVVSRSTSDALIVWQYVDVRSRAVPDRDLLVVSASAASCPMPSRVRGCAQHALVIAVP